MEPHQSPLVTAPVGHGASIATHSGNLTQSGHHLETNGAGLLSSGSGSREVSWMFAGGAAIVPSSGLGRKVRKCEG